jgi:hypothetical protein
MGEFVLLPDAREEHACGRLECQPDALVGSHARRSARSPLLAGGVVDRPLRLLMLHGGKSGRWPRWRTG